MDIVVGKIKFFTYLFPYLHTWRATLALFVLK